MNKKLLLILLNIVSFLCLYAADDKWDYNPYDYQYDMTVYATLNIDKASVNDLSGYSVAAFCADECRGVAELMTANSKEYLYLRVRSNQQSGEQITFKVLDTNSDRLLKCETTIEFSSESIIGRPSSPMVIEAANPYKVVYKIAEEEISTEEVYFGDPIPSVEAPEKEGYTFAGWQDVPESMPAKDLTITGAYTINSYKLTFKIDNTVISESEVEYGSPITPPEAPEKEGYTFGGWEEHPQRMPAHDLTINGYYEGQSFSLTYVIDDVVISETEVEFGTSLTPIEAPEKEGYTFAGWTGLPETMPAHPVTVTGSYTVNSYTLTFKIGNDVISETTQQYGSSIIEPEAPEKEGYVFGGWNEHPETMPAHDLTITGYYEGQAYSLTYVIDGEVVSESKIEYGTSLTPIEAPEKEGYTFSGWSGLPETMPAHDVTVTGSYTVNSYQLVFETDYEIVLSSYVEFGSQIEVPEAPEKEGYTFVGWQDVPETMPANHLTIVGSYSVNSYKVVFLIGDEVISEATVEYGALIPTPVLEEKEGYTFDGWKDHPSTMPAHDVTITGSYTVNSYTLTFMIDDELISQSVVEYGSQIVEPEAPQKEGYVFGGWGLHQDTMPSYDLTIYGFYEAESYTLTYVVDGEVFSETQVQFGTILTAMEAPEKEGYTFSGWSELPQTMPAHDLIVTGSFTINSYKLTFKIGNEVISETTQEYGSEIVEPEAPQKEGYVFGGWEAHPATMPAQDLTINGYYEGEKFTLTYVIDDVVFLTTEVEFGTAITAIEAPEKEGYTFSGWSELPQTMPAHDLTVTGSYTINSYKLIFKIGEEVISESTVEYGSSISVPEVPLKKGYTFSGWSQTPETMPAHDLTITGSYIANSYKVTFVIDGEVVSESMVVFGAQVVAPAVEEREGYTFTGWMELPQTMPAFDITVTGSYRINSYTLTFKIGDEVISQALVEYGSRIVEPEAPEKEGLMFAGWDQHPQTMPANDLVINGHYTGYSFMLTYVIDGEVLYQEEVDFGTLLTPVEAPEKEGYTFQGWSGLPTTMPDHDVTVTGSYTVNSYKLVFMMGDEVVSESTVEYGSVIVAPVMPEKEGYTFVWADLPRTMPAHDLTITGSYKTGVYKIKFIIGQEVVYETMLEYGAQIVLPEAPQKEGYTFAGWSTYHETMPDHDLVIIGHYNINSYTLTFKAADEIIRQTQVEYGSAIVEPATPKKEGYTFTGWDAHPTTMPAHDVLVNGHFTVNVYTLTYILDDVVISTSEVEFGTVLTAIEVPQKEGYTFSGWTELPETMPAKDLTVTGTYDINSYKLVFQIDEEVISESLVEYGSVIKAPEAPEKEGYTFSGWSEILETMPAHDLTITGTYDINYYKLIFMIEDEIFSESTVEYASVITAAEAPEKEGYTFSGWSEMPETMPAHDLTVTGTFTINSYKLIFKVGNDVVSETTQEYGSEIVEPDAPQKEGFTFKGWEAHPATMPSYDLTINGYFYGNSYILTYVINGEVIAEKEVEFGTYLTAIEAPEKEGYTFQGWVGLPDAMPAQDVTVTGSYSINSYTIRFVIGDEVISESTVEYASALTSPEAPEKEGYTFSGWEDVPETMPAHDLTISGSYTINYYSLRFVIDDQEISETIVEFGSEITAPEAPEKEGYTFSGWSETFETMPAQDLTITGSYSINSYKLIFMIGDEIISESTVEYASEITAPEAPEKEGFTFSGWEYVPETMPAEDVTITGSYTVNYYKMVYVIEQETIYEEEVAYGSTLEPIEAPQKEGYTFEGWEELPETMPAHDLRVEGFYSVNVYTVTYSLEDGTVIRVDEVEFGATLPEAPQAPEIHGYVFKGWNYLPEVMPAQDIVIVALYDMTTSISDIIEQGVEVKIYDLRGNRVKDDLQKLNPGIYIVNGQKVLVK